MTIEQAIRGIYTAKTAPSDEPDVNLLFDIILAYIKKMEWVYEGKDAKQNIHVLEAQSQLKVNCFSLTNLFVHMSQQIGVATDASFAITIPNFINTVNNPYVQGEYTPFTSTFLIHDDGFYQFDYHSIAMINGLCFDLMLQAKYPLINHGADIYSSLYLLMSDNDLEGFKNLLPELLDINEQATDTGWTLLHIALFELQFDFALELLKRGAKDNICNYDNQSALCFLNNHIHDSSVSLDTLTKAREYHDLKMQLLLQNNNEQLATANQTTAAPTPFWLKKQPSPQQSECDEATVQFNF